MSSYLKTAAAALALAALNAPLLVTPAAAQAVKGVGVVNIAYVVANSNAYKVATQQQPVTYKDPIDQANARRAAITQQIQPLFQKYQTDSQAATPNQQSLQQQAAQIQQIQQAGERELQQILQPVALSQAYVEEQIQDKLSEAVQSAAKKQNITIILTPENVVYAEAAYNMNQAVLDEVNRLIPAAQIVPPAGWLPREVREQQAQQQAQQQAAPAPAAAAPAVSGR